MTQEEKADVTPEISTNNDNILLQNEFLSKLINTPPNLTLKYENEELNKFKDEMLSYINERNNHILTLINYFQDKIKQTKEEYTSKLNLINQNYEAILSSQASIINKVDKITGVELFMNKTNDQIITHEIRINNLSQDFIKAVQKYDKIYLDNLELPGYIGKFAKFKNCQSFFDFLIREIDKTNLYKEKNNLDIKNYKERLDNTIKTFNLLFKNNNEAQMKYIRQINEKNFKECKDMNDALSNRVCDLRIENAKYSMDLIKRSEEMGKDWDKILKIKDEMLNTVNDKINGFRKIFNGNTTLFNEFRKEYEEFKLKINDILNYFKEFKNINENDKSTNNNNINNNPCNNYTGCYINSNLPSEKKSFKHFSKFAKRARSKNNKNLEKKQFIKAYMTINGTKLSIGNNEINTATNNGLLHIECINKDKKKSDTNNHSSLKKSAILSNNTSSNRESRSSKSVTKIEINSINKVLTSRDELKNNNNILNNKINTNTNNINNNNDIQVKINEEENNTNNNSNDNNNSENYNKSDMNINSKMKINNEFNKEMMNSLENNNQEKEKILLKINKKSRRSFAPSSKSIISYESESNNNINDISNITSNVGTSNHKTEDLTNMMNSSLYSANSFNINTNKFILNDNNNIIETNQQVIKELASELEQSTNKKDILNSNKKQIEESFKINRNKISKLNLNKTSNMMDITNSTEKTEDINNKCNNNININISGTLNKSINGNYDTIKKINKKMDIFDKKLFNLELLLKEKIIEILNQMEKFQNFFNITCNNNNNINNNNLTKMIISSIKTRNHLVPLYNTNTNINTNNNTKEINSLNTYNFNTNNTPNIILQNNEPTPMYDNTNNIANNDNINNNNNVNNNNANSNNINVNNINKRNSQDDYFIGCTSRRLAPIIEIDVNNLQFSPSHGRPQYKIYSSKKKEGRNKWNKSSFSNNYKDINIKKNENKENFRPNYTSYTNTDLNSNNNSTQIRLFGKGLGFGVNKWINLNKLMTHEKSSKDNITNTNII